MSFSGISVQLSLDNVLHCNDVGCDKINYMYILQFYFNLQQPSGKGVSVHYKHKHTQQSMALELRLQHFTIVSQICCLKHRVKHITSPWICHPMLSHYMHTWFIFTCILTQPVLKAGYIYHVLCKYVMLQCIVTWN